MAAGGCAHLPDDLPETNASLFYLNNAYRNFYNTLFAYRGPAVPMAVMADQLTWDFENYAYAEKFGGEPRQAFDNYYKAPDTYFIDRFWIGSYEVLNGINQVLTALDSGEQIEGFSESDVPMIRAWCRFIQGMVHGYLGLVFDKAAIQDEHSDPYHPVLSDWSEVTSRAVLFLDEAVKHTRESTFVIPNTWYSGTTISSDDLGRMASTFSAMILTYRSRNAAQNDTTAWNRVRSYAQSGITVDVNIETDNQLWVNSMLEKAAGPGYGRVDMRILHALDSAYPARYPTDGSQPDPITATSPDARLDTDFEFLPTVNFAPSSGLYLFSHYRLSKFDTWMETHSGLLPFVPVEENELILAEALVRTGNPSGAIDILNAGARTKRGMLPMLDPGATGQEILDAIFYEREIELIGTGMGTAFFDMRRRDLLQKGTLLHFPVPAEELEIMDLPIYSYGGEPAADGINTSNGGGF